jgi:Zn finger protein HypA/HybF involved in hydrogenase expression
VDIEIFCPVCGVERPILSFPLLICAECGATGDRVLRGQELEITAMEMIS